MGLSHDKHTVTNQQRKDLSLLMNPGSVAIIGDSPGKRGGNVHRSLVEGGFSGPIYPVHPRLPEVFGLRAYHSLEEVPGAVDFVAIALAAPQVPAAIDAAVQKGAKAALIVASGFAESGPDGLLLQEQIRQQASSAGLLICGPNCYGVANLADGFLGYSAQMPEGMKPGSIALVFQSGALTHGVTEPLVRRGIGYSHIITTGNEVVVELSDYVDYLAGDPRVSVIACFVEQFRNPGGFELAARKANSHRKRLVVLKSGRSDLGIRAALAHTGALVGSDRAVDAWLQKLGVARVYDLDELVETAILFSKLPDLDKGSPAILSISGGGSGVMADLAGDVGLDLITFPDDINDHLDQILPEFATANNPLDLTGAVGEREGIMDGVLDVVCSASGTSLVAWALNTPTVTSPRGQERYAHTLDVLGRFNGTSDTPVMAFTMTSGAMDSHLVTAAAEHDMALLQGMRTGMTAIARAHDLARQQPWIVDPDAAAGVRPPDVVAALDAWTGDVLSEKSAKSLLRTIGIAVTREAPAKTADEAADAATEIGFPVALKVDSADVPHKADVGGLLLALKSASEVRQGFATIVSAVTENVPGAQVDGVLVQEMVPDGLDVFLGTVVEPGIGPVVAVGTGGVLVEALDQISTALAPLLPDEAMDFLMRSPIRKMLAARRTRPAGDMEALAQIVTDVSRLAWWLRDDIRELDLNPVRVLADGQGAIVLDALATRRSGEGSQVVSL